MPEPRKYEFNNTLVTSRYKAFGPDGVFKEIVTLSNDAKKRYEAKGWTFQSTTLSTYTKS